MASSCSFSSSSSNSKRFDVFLSFGGKDTRRTFVSHLDKEFDNYLLNTFKDDKKLRCGDHIPDELMRAIEDSKIAVVVISKQYAFSGWCLKELEKIMECEENKMLTVFPIFYDVDPSDVRYQKGTFEEAFRKHEERQEAEKVLKWRKALTNVANISGKDCRAGKDDATSKDDATLVSEIAGEISNRLFSNVPSDSDGPLGMDAHLGQLNPLLNMGSDDEVRMVGIWGMGGVGKTTIAEYLYDMHKSRFPSHCFIRSIKNFRSEQGFKDLQTQFLSQIFKDRKSMPQIYEIGSNIIKSRLSGRKILAILDDVDNSDQLEALAKDTSWFGPGSRIIITTRDQQSLKTRGIEHVYEVKCLQPEAALRLFNHFAFRGTFWENQDPEYVRELSSRALRVAQGLPLAIKVLGKDLYGRKPEEWEDTIGRIEKVPDNRIIECLKVSYEGLDDRNKVIFLTVASLFNEECVNRLLQLLDDEECIVRKSLKMLEEKALISFSDDKHVMVHDLIQDMAKYIIHWESNNELGRKRFLLDANEIYDVLKDEMGTDAIEGISLDISKIENFPMGDKSFKNMRNLKFLVIRNTSHYKGDLLQLRAAINHLPRKLRLLEWENCPLKTLPSTFEAECLVELVLPNSDLEKLSEKTLFLKKLKRLEFRSCYYRKKAITKTTDGDDPLC